MVSVLFATASAAQEWVASRGPMDDESFYRLVACAAAPGGACAKPLVRWTARDARDLTVSIQGVAPGYSGARQQAISAALDAAIAEINAAGAGIRLRRVADGSRAKVALFLADVPEGTVLMGSSSRDRTRLGAATVQVWADNSYNLTNAAIIVARDIRMQDIRSIVLEELVQSLGLLTDLRNPYYTRRSIFSEDSNATLQLAGQDVMALRRHYPRGR